jgi:hypothetical protein
MRLAVLRRFRPTATGKEADIAQVQRPVQSEAAKNAGELQPGVPAKRMGEESAAVYRLGQPELGYSELPSAYAAARPDKKLGNLGPLV